jgi:hypothetical protein
MLKSAYTELQRKYDELLNRTDELNKQHNKSKQTITKLQSSTETAVQTSDADRKRREELELDAINNNNERIDSINELNELKEQLLQSKLDVIDSKVDGIRSTKSLDKRSNFQYEWKSNESETEFKWTTSRNSKLASSNEFGSLYIQNNHIDGMNITEIELTITEDPNDDGKHEKSRNILNHGPFGFTDERVPINIKSVNIEAGSNMTMPIFGGSDISGNSTRSIVPKGHSVFITDKTYRGTVQLLVTFENGDVEKSKVILWTVQKNKDKGVDITTKQKKSSIPDKVVWPLTETVLNSTKPVKETIPRVISPRKSASETVKNITPEVELEKSITPKSELKKSIVPKFKTKTNITPRTSLK